MDEIFIIGFSFLILGIILIFLSFFLRLKTKSEAGLIIWIGPFPVFSITTSKEIFYILLFLSLIFILFLILFYLLKA